jgi:maltose alpha-D-glucosyltransferase/alpha-amylase
VMPRIYMALRKGDVSPLVWILDRTPSIPGNCQWCTFLRNHDELTLEMVTEEERQWMWQEYAPDPRMRLNLGIRRRLAPLLDNNRRKIELANSLLFSLPGSPVIYYGDEIGMGENIWLPDRNGVRTPMQWDDGENAGFSHARISELYAPVIDSDEFGPQRINLADQRADPQSLWHVIQRMIAVRKAHPAFGQGDFTWAETGNLSIAAYWRIYEDQRILVVNNLSAEPQSFQITLPEPGWTFATLDCPCDIFSGEPAPLVQGKHLHVGLRAYQYRWFKF